MMILLLAAALGASPAPPRLILGTPPAGRTNCPIAEAHFTSGTIDGSKTKGFRALDQEPPAQTYLTVVRKIDNCTVPMIVPSMLTRGR